MIAVPPSASVSIRSRRNVHWSPPSASGRDASTAATAKGKHRDRSHSADSNGRCVSIESTRWRMAPQYQLQNGRSRRRPSGSMITARHPPACRFDRDATSIGVRRVRAVAMLPPRPRRRGREAIEFVEPRSNRLRDPGSFTCCHHSWKPAPSSRREGLDGERDGRVDPQQEIVPGQGEHRRLVDDVTPKRRQCGVHEERRARWAKARPPASATYRSAGDSAPPPGRTVPLRRDQARASFAGWPQARRSARGRRRWFRVQVRGRIARSLWSDPLRRSVAMLQPPPARTSCTDDHRPSPWMRRRPPAPRARPLLRQRLRIGELARGRRSRHVAFALHTSGSKGFGRGAGGRVGLQTGHPQRIERQAGGLEPAQNLNGRGSGFRLEHLVACERNERRNGLAAVEAPRHRPERREFGQQVVPGRSRLPFHRRKRPLSGHPAAASDLATSPSRLGASRPRASAPGASSTTPQQRRERAVLRTHRSDNRRKRQLPPPLAANHSASRQARTSQSSAAPAMWGERISAAARAIGSGACASAMMSSAAATSGASSKAAPSERL